MAAVGFRPARRSDLPMLRTWLETPEVVRWWGDPAEQYGLLDEDLDNPVMTMLVVELDGRPFAYAQHCDIAAWPQPCFAHLPAGTRAVDAFIGVAEMVGAGHGRAFLRRLAESLIAEGAPAVVIDPDQDNHRARRAYARAGFREAGPIETAEGPAILMLFEPGR